jgi:hypothetical protein
MENLKPPLPNLFPCGCQPVVRKGEDVGPGSEHELCAKERDATLNEIGVNTTGTLSQILDFGAFAKGSTCWMAITK